MPRRAAQQPLARSSSSSPCRRETSEILNANSSFDRAPPLEADRSPQILRASPADARPRAAVRSRDHRDDDDVAEVYHRRWSHVVLGATSGFLFSITCFVCYCCYRLMSPYGAGITFGIMLSIVLHPITKQDKKKRMSKCVGDMVRVNKKWGVAGRSPSEVENPNLLLWLRKLIGCWLSLVPFIRHSIFEGAMFLGMQKLQSAQNEPKKKATVGVRGQCYAVAIFVVTATMLTGIVIFAQIHAVLLALFIIFVQILNEENFVYYMEKLWKVSMIAFFCAGLGYSFYSDVLLVTDTVQRTTSEVVTSSRSIVEQRANWTELVLLKNKLLSDFVAANNLTEVVEHMKTLEPLVANLSWSSWSSTIPSNWTSFVNRAQQVYQGLQSSEHDPASFFASMFTSITTKSKYVGIAVVSVLLKIVQNVVNVFDGIYEIVLFALVFHYLTHLKHTVVYYLVHKMLSPLHHPLAKDHAKAIERDITISFSTLFQSFWHMTWFHFCATFCCFRLWSSPLPFFSGLVAVTMALFPFVPKWFSPCMIKLFFLIGDRIMGLDQWASATALVGDFELLTFAAIAFLVMKDDWLLSVERGLSGGKRQDARGVEREQLPTFLVGTCIILGLVVYGARGVLLGPLTVIVARTIFDNWDSLSSGVVPTAPRGADPYVPSTNTSRNGSFTLTPTKLVLPSTTTTGIISDDPKSYDVALSTDTLTLKKKQ